jgi:ribosomal protein L29
MDKDTLREMTIEELTETLEDKQQEYEKTALNMRMGQEQDLHAPRKLRKEVAVIKTIINEKQLDKLNSEDEDE